jgi:hypothetical protein
MHHIECVSHGILQEPEPRVESDEPPVEERDTHEIIPEEPLTQAYD